MGGVPAEYLELIAEPVQLKFDAFDHSGLPSSDPGPAAAEPLLVSEPEPEPKPEPEPEPVALETPPAPDIQSTPTHRVKHSFTAAQSWQLSVQPGQEVILVRSANGWAQIQLCSDPTTMGGVPDEYLELVSGSEPVQLKFDAFD